jgi:S1-C subfamily serine protease
MIVTNRHVTSASPSIYHCRFFNGELVPAVLLY